MKFMRLFAKEIAAVIWVLPVLCGCGPVRYEHSLIGPHPQDRPFQECSINLDFYKSVQQRPGQDANTVLAVAASGGGFRAANFTAGALQGLEELRGINQTSTNVLSQVDYFSTVSGGGFAVGVYISSLRDYTRFSGSADGYSFADVLAATDAKCPCMAKTKEEQKYDPCVRKHLQGLYKDFIADFLRTLLPWNHLGFDDRGQRFEQAIDDDMLGYRWRKRKLSPQYKANAAMRRNIDKAATLTLSDIFVLADDPNRQATLPYWFANAAVYQNVNLFPFSPDYLRLYEVVGYNHRGRKNVCEGNCPDLNDFAMKMPLSLAVTTSANFPLAMPPYRFISRMDPNNRYFYLLDGGVADNLGVVTALRVLGDKINENMTRKVLIVIDSYQGNLTPFEKIKNPPKEAVTAARLMETGLDTWRARYREITDGFCERQGIKPVYLSFDNLVETDFNDLYEFGLTEQDKKDLCKNKPKNCPSATPFHLVRSISMTSPVFRGKDGLEYQIPKSQQNLLIAAGRYVVNKKKSEILNVLGW